MITLEDEYTGWKKAYKGITRLIIVIVVVIFSIYLYNSYKQSRGFNFIYLYTNFIYSTVDLFVYYIYIEALNYAIEKKQKNTILKYLEYLSYLFLVSIFLSTFSYGFGRNIISISLKFIVGVFLVTAFYIRRKLLGRYDEISEYNYLKEKSFKTAEQKLELCKTCSNRTFNNDIGLVCSLTSQKPEFIGTCNEFNLDQKEFQRKHVDSKNTDKSSTWTYVLGALVIIRILLRFLR